MVRSSLAPKWSKPVPFWRMDNQKSNFLMIYGTSFFRRLLRPVYVTFLKTGWWNSNAQTSGIYRYLHYNLNVILSWCPRSSKYVKTSSNTLYVICVYIFPPFLGIVTFSLILERLPCWLSCSTDQTHDYVISVFKRLNDWFTMLTTQWF